MAENKLTFESFRTTHDFMRAVQSRPQNDKCPNNEGKNNDNDFCGGLSWEQSLEALEKGLPSVCDALKSDLRKFKETGAMDIGSRTQPRNHYYGSKPNVAAAIQGRPKSMRQRQRQPVKVKTVRIIYDCCQNAGTSAKTLQQSGTAVLCLVYALEKAGYRVSFDLLPFTADNHGEYAISLVNLKEYKQPLDLLKLSFPITHAAMFRRFGFTWLETVSGLESYFYGYGRHIDREVLIKQLEKARVLNTVGYVIQVDDCQRAKFDVKRLAANLGISL